MNVAIAIPDEIGSALGSEPEGMSRAVLEAVAAEAYRAGRITSAQVQQLLGFASRWQTDAFLRRVEAYHAYTVEDLERDIQAIRAVSKP